MFEGLRFFCLSLGTKMIARDCASLRRCIVGPGGVACVYFEHTTDIIRNTGCGGCLRSSGASSRVRREHRQHKTGNNGRVLTNPTAANHVYL